MLDQGNKCRRDQQFVGNRIEQDPQSRNLTSLSGQVAVQQIRQGSCQEDQCRDEHVVLGQQNCNQQRNSEYADQSQRVRKIHGPDSSTGGGVAGPKFWYKGAGRYA